MFWNKKILLISVLFLFFSLNAFSNGIEDLPKCTVNQDGTQKTCRTVADCDGGRCFQEYRECMGTAVYPKLNPTTEINPRTDSKLTFNYPFTNEGRNYTKLLQTGYIVDYECIQGKCVVTNRTITRVKCLLGCDIEKNQCVCPERPDRFFCKPEVDRHIHVEYTSWDCNRKERLYRKCPFSTACGPSPEHPEGVTCIPIDSPGPIQGPDGKWYASTGSRTNSNTGYASVYSTSQTTSNYYKPSYSNSPYSKTYYRKTYYYTPKTTSYTYKSPTTRTTKYYSQKTSTTTTHYSRNTFTPRTTTTNYYYYKRYTKTSTTTTRKTSTTTSTARYSTYYKRIV